MLKYFNSSKSHDNNDVTIAYYIKSAKPLILSLPDINDKLKAFAWFKKIIYDNSNLTVRAEYLKLLLKYLKHKKLSGPFAGLPDTKRPLQELNSRKIIQQPLQKCDNIKNNFPESIPKNKGYNDFIPENYRLDTLRSNCRKIVHQTYDTENNTQCISKNNRVVHQTYNTESNTQCISKNNRVLHQTYNTGNNIQCIRKNNKATAGFSSITEKDIKYQIQNVIKSSGDNHEKIDNCKNMLEHSYLPPTTTSHGTELKTYEKKIKCHKREIVYNKFDVTQVYGNTVENFPIIKKKCRNKKCKKNVENTPIKSELREENTQNKTLEKSYDNENGELESFLTGPKKFFTLSVSKECLMDRNIFKCIKYVISNAQCSYYKLKELCKKSKKKFNAMRSETSNTSKRSCRPCVEIRETSRNSSLINKSSRRNRNSITYDSETGNIANQNGSLCTCLQNAIANSSIIANLSETIRNIIRESIYIQMSLILTVGSLFFWKLFRTIFACRCRERNNSEQLISLLLKIKKCGISPQVFVFVFCFILYEVVKDCMH